MRKFVSSTVSRLSVFVLLMSFSFTQVSQSAPSSSKTMLSTFGTNVAPPGAMPPECWKCVYDFRDCTTGTSGNWVIAYTPMTTTTTRYDMSNGGISITRFTYETPSRATVDYVNSYYSTASCEGVYRNCMMSCRY